MIALLVLIALVFGAWYRFASVVARSAALSTRLVLISLGMSGQLVVTVTIAGAVGALRGAVVAGVLVGVSLVLVGAAARVADTRQPSPGDLRAIATGLRAVAAWETVLLAALFAFAAAWITTALRFYPPRGIDDVTYHLPPVYQSIQDHRLTLLPVELRGHFGYPLNGEQLFLLVPLFTGNIRWIAAPQTIAWIVGMLAVFALARRCGLAARGALLAAGLFGAMPVSLLQTTTNYVDLIAAVWLLSAAVALWEYEETGSGLALALAGLGVGLLAGSKASTLTLCALFVLFATIVIVRRVDRPRDRIAAFATFAVPLVASGAYWYVRDWVVLGNPLYPYPIHAFGRLIFPGPIVIGPTAWAAIVADPAEAGRIALWDPGLGTFHGGFGFLFWGFAVPAVGLQVVRLVRRSARGSATEWLLWLLLPAGLATLFLVGRADLFVFARLVLFVGAPVFIGYARLVDEARSRLPGVATALRAVAIGAAASALLIMAAARWPLVNLQPVALDTPEQRTLSPFRYLAWTNWDQRPLSTAWAPLDEITRGGAGLTVYQAADWAVFWTASTFGSELQNRVWNFARDPERPPDAFLFHSRSQSPFYLGREIRRDTVAFDSRFRLIAASPGDVTTLYVAAAALAGNGREARLARYYRLTSPQIVATTAKTLTLLDAGSMLLAQFPFAAGYVVHEADGRLTAELHPAALEDVDRLAAAWPDRVVYTTGRPIPGRPSRAVAMLEREGVDPVPLIRHDPARAPGETR